MLKTSLRYLMSVARHGSIRAASNELNIAQSAVSRRLQALEYQLGTPLFERKPRGVVLTEAGRLLYDHCLNTTFAIDRLYSELDELRGLLRGRVHLASMESVTTSILAYAMAEFHLKHPGITFSVEVETSDKVLHAVREGDVDFGLTLGRSFPLEIAVSYQASYPLYAAVRPDHALAQLASVPLDELVKWPLALAPHPSASRQVFEDCCRRARVAVTPALETNSVELMRSFALSGGVTPMLRYATIASVAKGELCAIPLSGEGLSIDISLIKLRDRQLPLASEKFLAEVIAHLQAAPSS